MWKKLIFLLVMGMVIYSCAKVPMSGRSQLALVSNEELLPLSYQQYNDVIKDGKIVTNTTDGQMVVRVGKRIADAVEKYMRENGYEKELQGFAWEFNLIQEDIVNAWCMPGEKWLFIRASFPSVRMKQVWQW
jgi:predicted Zn-dependent protease